MPHSLSSHSQKTVQIKDPGHVQSNAYGTAATEHLPGYQERDREIVDYQMYQLGETGLWFRGPKPVSLEPNQYFVCIGAAQTFGCFCEDPFPNLLETKLGLPALNLGYGGAGPYFFLRHPALLEYINRAKFVVVQVTSGRSESNSLFDSGGLELLTRRSDGAQLGADAAYKELLSDSLWWKMPAGKRSFRRLGGVLSAKKAKRLVSETRSNWIEHHQALLEQINVPKVLLWFSKRSPDYQERYDSLRGLFNDFPQLVNRDMVDQIKIGCDEYVECVSQRGIPQPLINRMTGEPTTVDPSFDRKDLGGKIWTHNTYYPSPEMHQDAFQLLKEVCEKY